MPRADFPAPEFLDRPQAAPMLLRILLLVAIAAVSVAAIDAVDAWGEREAASSHLAALQRLGDAPRPAPSATASPGEVAVRKRLAMPWSAVFVGTESASVSGVQWLALRSGSERNALQLEGRLPQSQDASAVVNALAAQPGWKDVVLNRLQPDPPGGVRFDIDARLE